MELFFELLGKLTPIYFLVIVGYLAGKYADVKKETVASILIYVIAPIVIFNGLLQSEINGATLSIPLIFLSVSCLCAISAFFISRFFWNDSTRNAVSFIAGSSNSGFFGLPVAVAIFGPSVTGIVASAILGTTIYLNTLGIFIAAKGSHTTRESIIKVLKMPILHAFILGVILNLTGFHLNQTYETLANNFNGAFIVLGMMLVGIGISDVKKFEFDKLFIWFTFFGKFVLWPVFTFLILLIDRIFFGIYDDFTRNTIMILSLVPVAGNIVGYSTILKLHPEKSALSVLLTTIFASVLIPVVAAIFFL